ncbi:MAG: hypothetical protein RMM08_05905 [Armatimonadota bacterium]|nr:hypothetical protein [bacterium]MDW8320878.1 hypothetical protein [Armatimonadota bacterium]
MTNLNIPLAKFSEQSRFPDELELFDYAFKILVASTGLHPAGGG